jgi:hypothetical protein
MLELSESARRAAGLKRAGAGRFKSTHGATAGTKSRPIDVAAGHYEGHALEHRHVVELSAGGRWIRTIGPERTSGE